MSLSLETEVKSLQLFLQEKQKMLGLLNTNVEETIELHKERLYRMVK